MIKYAFMSIASQEACLELKKRFTIDATPGLGCHYNAFIAALKIYVIEGQFPQIWQIRLPEINDFHSYLVHNEKVYNDGVTWTDSTYPDLDLETLKARGQNVTSRLIIEAIKPLIGQKDKCMFLPILELITDNDPKILLPFLIDAWCEVNKTSRDIVLKPLKA